MNFDGTGLLTGVMGLCLAAVGVLVAALAGLRLLFLIRRPGKGRIARGIAVGGVVLILCGAVLLAAEELDVFRHTTDQAALLLSALSVLLAAYAGIRAGLRRSAAAAATPASAPEKPEGAAPDDRAEASR